MSQTGVIPAKPQKAKAKDSLRFDRFGLDSAGMTPIEKKSAISGYDLKYRIEGLVAGITNKKINHVYQGDGAATAPGLMILPRIVATSLFPQKHVNVLLGYTAHEICHQLQTDFEKLNAFIADPNIDDKKKNHVKQYWNAIDDYRIEKLTNKIYPGFKIYINHTRDFSAERFCERVEAGLFGEDVLKNPYKIGAVALTWVGAALNGYTTTAPNKALSKLEDNFRAWVEGWADDLKLVETNDDAWNLALKIYDELEDMRVNPQDSGEDGSEKNQENQENNSQSGSESAGNNSSDNNENNEEESSQGNENSSDNSSADNSPDNSPDNDQGKSEKTGKDDSTQNEESEENSSNNEQPDGSNSADDDSSEDDASSSGNKDSDTGSGSETDEKDPSNESGKAEDSSEENSSENSSETNESSDKDNSNPKDENNSSSEDDTSQNQSSGCDNEDLGSSSQGGSEEQESSSNQNQKNSSQKSSSSTGKSQSRENSEDTGEADSGSASDDSSSSQENSKRPRLKIDEDADKVESEEADLEIDELAKVISNQKGPEAQIPKIRNEEDLSSIGASNDNKTEIIQRAQKDYYEVRKNIGSGGGRAAGILRRMLQSRARSTWRGGKEEGRLDFGRLVPMTQGHPDVYQQKNERTGINTAVSLLLDNSGSMSGNPLRVCQETSVVLDMAIQGTKTNLEVNGFTSENFSKPIIYRYRAFGQSGQAAAASLGNMTKVGLGGTPVSVPLLETWRRLSHQKEPRKIMIVVSDGGADYNDQEAAKIAHDFIISQGCPVLGISIGSPMDMQKWCENVQSIDSVDELPVALTNLIREVLK
jgi:hypothetical protein